MSISTRLSIRWLPNPPSEPTSTIVLTLPKTHMYIDLRLSVSKPELYWGLAGYSTHVGNTCTFSHLIDSRGQVGATDIGVNTTQPDGTILETGSMLNFDTGKVEDYEEVWFEEKREEYVGLIRVEGEATGIMARVGEWWQVMVYEDGEVKAARWRKQGEEWEMIWGVEEEWDGGPPVDVLNGQVVGNVIRYAGREWNVVELSDESS
ncbi:hypothetical protein BJ165DRAFT_1486649 [Panaeolus papilionaceus]|nr:hypothetical protein BJ165DRAFT_1486649 [Panaeolus papilionaceus]